MPSKQLEDISVKLLHETPRAWCVDDGTKRVWIPKSQAELSEVSASGTFTLTAPRWLLKDKGLI